MFKLAPLNIFDISRSLPSARRYVLLCDAARFFQSYIALRFLIFTPFDDFLKGTLHGLKPSKVNRFLSLFKPLIEKLGFRFFVTLCSYRIECYLVKRTVFVTKLSYSWQEEDNYIKSLRAEQRKLREELAKRNIHIEENYEDCEPSLARVLRFNKTAKLLLKG